MYPTGGGNAYGQQPYASQHGYGQSAASGYHGTSTLSPDSLRHSAMAGGHQDAHMSVGYRGLSSSGALSGGSSAPAPTQYGAHYGTAYGSPQLDVVGGKGTGLSALQDRAGGSKFSSGDIGSNLGLKTADYDYGYGRKIDPFGKGKVSEYPLDRSHYVESQSTYIGRDLQSESVRTYSDYATLSHQYQSDLRDQASLLHHQQLLPTETDVRQSLSASALDASMRPSGYLAARTGATRHGSQDPAAYGTRMDADARSFSSLGGGSYAGQHPASILGPAARSNFDDLYHTHGPSGAGYGVGLPPGRDYSTGKGLGNVLDYPGGTSSHSGHMSVGGPRLEDRKDNQGILRREFDIREEDRRRDHARERERERERDRERERKRERERARLIERHEERDRERKREREREVRRDRTPPRMMRDHQGSKERFLRKDSTCHGVTHRRHSPLKERRRDYICKAYPFCLVDTERDFMSVTKRYPKLSVSPEFCKLIIYWPNHKLNVPFRIPVSFEHELLEVDGDVDQVQPSAAPSAEENSGKSCGVKTIWKAKVILMSGISDDAFEDLSSKKNVNDRIPHYNNILRFVVLKKDRCFMAIGGRWNREVDGGDPSVDDTALIRTALRHTKEITQLDLHSCIHWNRFLEVHYDRVGRDGLFSHKEISVYFIPNLSECLPSLDVWRTQWLAQRHARLESEQLRLKKEKSKSVERKDVKGNIGHGKPEDGDSAETEKKITVNLDVKKQNENVNTETTLVKDKSCEDIREEEKTDKEMKSESSQVLKTVADGKEKSANADQKENEMKDENNETEEPADHSSAKETAVPKSGKKRIVRKVVTKKGVKGKVASAEERGESADGAEDGNKGRETDGKDVVAKEQSELEAKKVGKKKIIKKAVKRKVVTKTEKATDIASDNNDNEVGGGEENTGKEQENKEAQDGHVNEKENGSNSKIVLAEKKDEVATGNEEDTTNRASKVEKEDGLKKEGDANKNDTQPNKFKLKSEKDRNKDDKESIEVKDNSTKETKDKQGGLSEKHPPYPGFFLETKVTKELKLRTTSFSLEGLLDYSEKDTEESTFELSMFAEVLYEMLQYQMGCHILAYLEGLHPNLVKKRNARKRSRDEDPDKVNGDERLEKKRSKSSERHPAENDSSKPGLTLESDVNTEGILVGESAAEHDDTENADNTDLEMKDAGLSDVRMPEGGVEDKMVDSETNAKKGDLAGGTDTDKKPNLEEHKATIENKKALSGKADDVVKERCIDKELLQAFHFFDRNRVGYVKVEDLRTVIHSLGKFLSNRQVKELVNSALLETTTSRDNRIFYEKLVVLSDS